jgi:hypothetical protein
VGYASMTSLVNIAIYTFGGLMLFALAIFFCRAGLMGQCPLPFRDN